ncbi:archaetidylserine decarboxylase [Shimazuella alba]|uniref:Phosphatidylserine decarboxylase proenzyme n=1 Tax=Shimazuella alba TaxID=2690964 RepID=A0A6I4W101_9BACL|nr:archaetidylserine decarboxylase [Shimazuella alba]MXQ54374.1 phosphatidylserine decarboxylase [Shimazuella alba]
MKDPVLRFFWKITPKNVLSRLVGNIAKKPFSRHFIPFYIKKFQIDLNPVKKQVGQFDNLLDFFVRELHDEARPIDPNPNLVVSPVDGVITQIGKIDEGTLIQAKGISYHVNDLLANIDDAKFFLNGQFATIYLSPRDYHRIHSPIAGQISSLSYIPGNLYPVNESGVRLFPGLFVQNERVISYIEGNAGTVALVKVGATNVGSIKVSFDDQISTNTGGRHQQNKKVYVESIQMKKGEELGRFEFGSTVILLFEENAISWLPSIQECTSLKMGQPIAEVNP